MPKYLTDRLSLCREKIYILLLEAHWNLVIIDSEVEKVTYRVMN